MSQNVNEDIQNGAPSAISGTKVDAGGETNSPTDSLANGLPVIDCRGVDLIFPSASSGAFKSTIGLFGRRVNANCSTVARDESIGSSGTAFPDRKSGWLQVLQGLDLRVHSGQIVSLLGASGCGKSSLLRVISGLQKPTAGQVFIGGRSLHAQDVAANGASPTTLNAGGSFDSSNVSDRLDASSARRAGVELDVGVGVPRLSFVFQEAALLPWRTVWENVHTPLELQSQARTLTSKNRTELVEHWLGTVGLARADWGKKPSQLSGGMKMRASIARSMVTNPQILLMDEPFSALDDVLRSKLCDLVLRIVREHGCTVLFVTHNIAEAVYLSDRVDVMAKGRIARSLMVQFERERNIGLRTSPEFGQMYAIASDALFQAAAV